MLIAVFIFAVLVEGSIEYFGEPIPSKWKRYLAAAVGVVVCIGYRLDLIAVVLASLGTVGIPVAITPIHPVIGYVLTGIIISRGSNYVNDFIERIRYGPKLPSSDDGTRTVGSAIAAATGATEPAEQRLAASSAESMAG